MSIVKKEKIKDAIKSALAGRTQRWLALQIGLTDTQFSNKMQGIGEFSPENIELINKILKTKL